MMDLLRVYHHHAALMGVYTSEHVWDDQTRLFVHAVPLARCTCTSMLVYIHSVQKVKVTRPASVHRWQIDLFTKGTGTAVSTYEQYGILRLAPRRRLIAMSVHVTIDPTV